MPGAKYIKQDTLHEEVQLLLLENEPDDLLALLQRYGERIEHLRNDGLVKGSPMELLRLGAAALKVFVQANFVGPTLADDLVKDIQALVRGKGGVADLEVDGESLTTECIVLPQLLLQWLRRSVDLVLLFLSVSLNYFCWISLFSL